MFRRKELQIKDSRKRGYRAVQVLFAELTPYSWTTPFLSVLLGRGTKLVCFEALCFSMGWELRERPVNWRK